MSLNKKNFKLEDIFEKVDYKTDFEEEVYVIEIKDHLTSKVNVDQLTFLMKHNVILMNFCYFNKMKHIFEVNVDFPIILENYLIRQFEDNLIIQFAIFNKDEENLKKLFEERKKSGFLKIFFKKVRKRIFSKILEKSAKFICLRKSLKESFERLKDNLKKGLIGKYFEMKKLRFQKEFQILSFFRKIEEKRKKLKMLKIFFGKVFLFRKIQNFVNLKKNENVELLKEKKRNLKIKQKLKFFLLLFKRKIKSSYINSLKNNLTLQYSNYKQKSKFFKKIQKFSKKSKNKEKSVLNFFKTKILFRFFICLKYLMKQKMILIQKIRKFNSFNYFFLEIFYKKNLNIFNKILKENYSKATLKILKEHKELKAKAFKILFLYKQLSKLKTKQIKNNLESIYRKRKIFLMKQSVQKLNKIKKFEKFEKKLFFSLFYENYNLRKCDRIIYFAEGLKIKFCRLKNVLNMLRRNIKNSKIELNCKEDGNTLSSFFSKISKTKEALNSLKGKFYFFTFINQFLKNKENKEKRKNLKESTNKLIISNKLKKFRNNVLLTKNKRIMITRKNYLVNCSIKKLKNFNNFQKNSRNLNKLTSKLFFRAFISNINKIKKKRLITTKCKQLVFKKFINNSFKSLKTHKDFSQLSKKQKIFNIISKNHSHNKQLKFYLNKANFINP